MNTMIRHLFLFMAMALTTFAHAKESNFSCSSFYTSGDMAQTRNCTYTSYSQHITLEQVYEEYVSLKEKNLFLKRIPSEDLFLENTSLKRGLTDDFSTPDVKVTWQKNRKGVSVEEEGVCGGREIELKQGDGYIHLKDELWGC